MAVSLSTGRAIAEHRRVKGDTPDSCVCTGPYGAGRLSRAGPVSGLGPVGQTPGSLR